jgi:hypothetical protein
MTKKEKEMADAAEEKRVEVGVQYFENIISNKECPITLEKVMIYGWIISGHTLDMQRNTPVLYSEEGLKKLIKSNLEGPIHSDFNFMEKFNEITNAYRSIKDKVDVNFERCKLRDKYASKVKNLTESNVELEVKRNELEKEFNTIKNRSGLFFLKTFVFNFFKNILIILFQDFYRIFFQDKKIRTAKDVGEEMREICENILFNKLDIMEKNDELNSLNKKLYDCKVQIQNKVFNWIDEIKFFSSLEIRENKSLKDMVEYIECISGSVIVKRNITCPMTRRKLPFDVATQPIKDFIAPFILAMANFFVKKYGSLNDESLKKDPEFQSFAQFVESLYPIFSMKSIDEELIKKPPIIRALEKFQQGEALSEEDRKAIQSFGLQDWQLQKLCHEFLPNLNPSPSQDLGLGKKSCI